MSMSDVRGANVGANNGFNHGRSLQSQERNRAKSRTRVHGLADIDPKFISQVRRGREDLGAFFCQFLLWAFFLPNDISYFASNKAGEGQSPVNRAGSLYSISLSINVVFTYTYIEGFYRKTYLLSLKFWHQTEVKNLRIMFWLPL